MKKFAKNILIVFVVFLFIAGILSIGSAGKSKAEQISLSRLVSHINAGEVQRIEVQENNLTITLTDGTELKSRKEREAALTESLVNLGAEKDKLTAVEIENKEISGSTVFLQSVLPFLIPLLLIGAFIYFLMRQVAGANSRALSFGQSQAKLATGGLKKRVTFADVAGLREAKEELTEIVEFLRYPRKFLAIGARIPKGVLLMGPPGTGKTLLARAVAGEANVPFFHMSGSEFVEMFVGVGASRVRDLFRRAKKQSPSIVFVDEIDAVGRQRGAGLGGGHDEREQTLNQILVEMDGFDNETNVIVMAATNRPDVLDPALLRPGRFDRQVVLDNPDINEREEILKIHSRNKPFAKDVNLRKIAERTPGFTGADLENIVNEAAILAARNNRKIITQEDLTASIEKVMLGPERKGHILSQKEKSIAAYHEAGHALVAAVLPNADPVHKVSIVSRGRAAGYTLKLPIEDRHLHSKSEFLDDIAVSMGGLVAEKLKFNEMTTGAANDLKVATDLARKMVTVYGMSEKLGPITFGGRHDLVFLGKEIHEEKNYSEKVASKIDEEVSSIIQNAYKTAGDIVKKFKHKLEEIAEKLLKQETIEQQEFEEIVKDIVPLEKRKDFGKGKARPAQGLAGAAAAA